MDRAENNRTGGGSFFQSVGKNLIGPGGISRVRIPDLLRKSDPVQPFQKLIVHPGAAESVLRGMDMQIHHAGQDQTVPAVNDLQRSVLFRYLTDVIKNTPAGAFRTDNAGMLPDLQAAQAGCMTDISF